MMFFSEEFIASVEENPIAGIIEASDITFKRLKELDNGQEWSEEEHELMWEAAYFIQLIIETNELKFVMDLPKASGDMTNNCSLLKEYLDTANNYFTQVFTENSVKLKIDSYKNRYKSALKGAFAYEFTQGDLDRIQLLVNELRTQISENQYLEKDHKQRLLKRLEYMQSELHKRVSDLDRFWGLVGDAGVVLGKLGTDAKPIVDRVREIAEIVWKTQARTEELPSNSLNPMLENDKDT